MKRLDRRELSWAAMVVVGMAPVLLFTASRAFGDTKEEWKAPARAARKKNPVPADEKSLATGKGLYTKECNSCHGPTGKGDGSAAKDLKVPPGDLSKPKMWEQTDGALFWKITEGKKPMPSQEKTWTEEQRWNCINYVRTLAPRPAETPKDSGPGQAEAAAQAAKPAPQ